MLYGGLRIGLVSAPTSGSIRATRAPWLGDASRHSRQLGCVRPHVQYEPVKQLFPAKEKVRAMQGMLR